MQRVAILGTGAWSTANAILLANKGIEVHLWGRRPDHVADLSRDRVNSILLPGVHLPETIRLTSDPEEAFHGVTHVAVGIPTQHIRKTLHTVQDAYPRGIPTISLSKGVEIGTLLRPTQIISEIFADAPLASLSGPSHAEEVARGMPTSVVIASEDRTLAADFQSIWNTPLFRVYSNADLLGVEIAGATKNIIALAAGVCDGMGFGDNSKAALLTRGLAELVRFGVAYGGRRETFYGLSGLGDIVVTGTSTLSRNWAMGNMIGKGLTLEEATQSTEKVAEGVWTTEAIHDLAHKLDVEMPITAEVHRVLFEGKSPRDGVRDLMTRSMKSEEESLPP